MIKFLNRKYYAGCYVYLYSSTKRYFKIVVDKAFRNKGRIAIYKQDLRGKLLSSYKYVADFENFKKAKQYLKGAA
jgi:hypothetical protein